MEGLVILVALSIPFIVSGMIGMSIAARKEAEFVGFLLGFFFGPIGWLLAILVDGRPKCHMCQEHISSKASICSHCRTNFFFINDKPVTKEEYLRDQSIKKTESQVEIDSEKQSKIGETPDEFSRIDLGNGRIEYKKNK